MSDGEKLLARLGLEALRKMRRMANNEETAEKNRIDIYKWMAEMYLGKPGSRVSREPEEEGPVRIRFDGELEEWSG